MLILHDDRTPAYCWTVTNLERNPQEQTCPPGTREDSTAGACLRLWPEREVPLGGVRAMNVQRTLPQRGLPTVGAWCFLDSFGPDRTAMTVLPHPHTGLQTVTWPLAGTIRHRDSVGTDVLVRPGELNIMTAGRGVSHSEFAVLSESAASADDAGQLRIQRGLQLWVALPAEHRHRAPSFEQHKNLPVASSQGFSATVMVGTFAGITSPATMYSAIVGADIECAGQALIPLDQHFEHAILVLDGGAVIDGTRIEPGPLAYLGSGRETLAWDADPGTRLLLIGGEPFEEELLMWWNFVGRTHEEVAQAREEWEAQAHLSDPEEQAARFGFVAGHGPGSGPQEGRIPAPPLPSVRLSPRRRS